MVSAATNPPGVSVMPLNLIEAGPSSEPWGWPRRRLGRRRNGVHRRGQRRVARLEIGNARSQRRFARLHFRRSVHRFDSFRRGFHARAFAAAAASRASSICLSRLLSSSFNSSSCSCCACIACLQLFEFSCDFRIRLRGFLGCGLGLGRLRRFCAPVRRRLLANRRTPLRRSETPIIRVLQVFSLPLSLLFRISKFGRTRYRKAGKFTPRENL